MRAEHVLLVAAFAAAVAMVAWAALIAPGGDI